MENGVFRMLMPSFHKSRQNKRILMAIAVSAISLAAIADTIKLEYGEFDSDLRQLADFEEIQLLKIKLYRDTVETDYDLVAVTVSPDSISEQLISTVMPITLRHDTTEFNVLAKPLGNDSVRIQVAGSNYKSVVHIVPTFQCILYNYLTQSEFDTDEEIPLFAYARGAEHEIEWDGQKLKAYNYCMVRECGKHPSEWGKTFHLPTYIYYVLRPKKQPIQTDNYE